MMLYVFIGSGEVNGGLFMICLFFQFIHQYIYYHLKKKENKNSCVDSRSRQQFKDENAQRPVVDSSIVTFVEDDLRCNVLGSPAESPRLAGNAQQFREAEIHLNAREWKKR